jgi:uracil-DNA glycosylase
MKSNTLSFSTIKPDWLEHFLTESEKPYFHQLDVYLTKEYAEQSVFPPQDEIFNAFGLTSYNDVKVVIIGQDPYHSLGINKKPHAHGLAFSINDDTKLPPSLKNIFKELSGVSRSGNLSVWAEQGVLLLNTVLTVTKGEPKSHAKRGWEKLTASILKKLNEREKPCIFLAWGKDAHKLCGQIDNPEHFIIKTSHPSPLGVTKSGKGFISFRDSRCFDRANGLLHSVGQKGVIW